MKLPIAALTLCLSLASVARAQNAVDDPRIVQARKACLAGDVQQGIRVLADLYVATDDPIWIFNQGRCYQQNNQPSNALARFKEFLRKSKGGPDDDDVKDAKRYIHEIEAELQQPSRPAEGQPGAGEGPSTAAASDASEPPLPAPSMGLTSSPTPDGTLTTVPEQSAPKPPVYKRWWFWTGVAAAVTAGTVTAILLSRDSGNNGCTGWGSCLEYR